jgi:hypothetical protein
MPPPNAIIEPHFDAASSKQHGRTKRLAPGSHIVEPHATGAAMLPPAPPLPPLAPPLPAPALPLLVPPAAPPVPEAAALPPLPAAWPAAPPLPLLPDDSSPPSSSPPPQPAAITPHDTKHQRQTRRIPARFTSITKPEIVQELAWALLTSAEFRFCP